MKKLYAADDPFLLQSLRSELDEAGIPYLVKNEFAGGAVGELPWQDVQREVWLVDESWWQRATTLLSCWQQQLSSQNRDDWVCCHCNEVNGAAFEACWQCGTVAPHAEH
ncbi:putative signal transducing protein [Alteromonas sp. CYL-A6]|uniref:putative signal transducing protein n=1 Tax=Alteromonas nitratireducens TaxID=3390813 RepID=UPI0034AC283B